MKLQYRFDINRVCNALLEAKLKQFNVDFDLGKTGEIVLSQPLSPERVVALQEDLSECGIFLVKDEQDELIFKIKTTIARHLRDNALAKINLSSYLTDELNYSYAYLSSKFSEKTFSTIENYYILQKIEHAKHLINQNDTTLTEIAHQLHYSSVAHLSTQFKKVTGLTPSQFQRIIIKRRTILLAT